ASYLGAGNYQEYGKNEVEAQIKALNESGIDEYLIWNASNKYTENVDYTPSIDEDVLEETKKKDADLRQENEEEEKGEEDEKDDKNRAIDAEVLEETKKKDADLREAVEEEESGEDEDKDDNEENDTNEEENEEDSNEESDKDPA